MKQLVAAGTNGPVIERLQLSALDDNQVLIKNKFSLVSAGTELHYIDQCRQNNERLRLGYCTAGTVEKLGTSVTGLQVGQKVIAMGWEYACHAEFVQVPRQLVLPVPEDLCLQQALLANLLATAVHAADRGQLQATDKVLIVGAGLVGRLVAAYAKTVTPDVVVTDQLDDRIKHLKTFTTAGCDDFLTPSTHWDESFTKAFICIKGDATQWLTELPRLLNRRGNEQQRPRIIGVGRFTADVTFSVEMGNIDIVFSARCGEGYRDDSHVHGLNPKIALPGEATVEENLARALAVINNGSIDLTDLAFETTPFLQAPKLYSHLKVSPLSLAAVLSYAAH